MNSLEGNPGTVRTGTVAVRFKDDPWTEIKGCDHHDYTLGKLFVIANS